MTLTFNDLRSGDRYEIELTEDGDFDYAARFIGRIGIDPLYYPTLRDIPSPQRQHIEHLIWQARQK